MIAEKYLTSDPEHIFMLRQLDKFMCGLARCFQFKKELEIGNTAIKTYVSEKKSTICSMVILQIYRK